jgi:hypothetical protein
MYTNETTMVVATLSVSKLDAIKAACVLLNNETIVTDVKAAGKTSGTTLRGYLFQMLKEGALRPELEAFRAECYAEAEARGIEVNTRTNSVQARVSETCTFVDRPDAPSIIASASNLGECLKMAKAINKAADDLEADRIKMASALAKDVAEQQERDQAAQRELEALEESKLDGSYAARLLQEIDARIAALLEVGVTVKVQQVSAS